MNHAKIGMCGAAVIIKEHDPLSSINANKSIASSEEYWHKILVFNTYKLDRDVVLRSIMKCAEPHDFVPIKYETYECSATFLVYKCFDALVRLCVSNLMIKVEDDTKHFKLGVILGYSLANQEIRNVLSLTTQAIVKKRYNANTLTLNLDSFHKDSDHMEYTPLWQHRLLRFVLYLCKPYRINVLKLSNNDIKALPDNFHTIFKQVTSLDLRNNCIESLNDVVNGSTCPIVEIFLDGNPLCKSYNDVDYIKAVKRVFPKLEKLDGFSIGTGEFLPFRRNYLCDLNGQIFVDQFLEQYYSYYDSQLTRPLLVNMYHESAFFSLTKQYVSGQNSSANVSFSGYVDYSRNLKYVADFSRGGGNLFVGKEAIAKVLIKLPQCEHDPYTFTVDLVYYTDTTAIIMVTGVFREMPSTLNSKEYCLGFARTFVISKIENSNSFYIMNDQFHIYNSLTKQEQRAFKQNLPEKTLTFNLPQPKIDKEQNELVHVFSKLTTLNLDWSKKCLLETSYDLKKSLEYFLWNIDSIPKNSFELNVDKSPALSPHGSSSPKLDKGLYSVPADERYKEAQIRIKNLITEKGEDIGTIAKDSQDDKFSEIEIVDEDRNDVIIIEDDKEEDPGLEGFDKMMYICRSLLQPGEITAVQKKQNKEKALATFRDIRQHPEIILKHDYKIMYKVCDLYTMKAQSHNLKAHELKKLEGVSIEKYGKACIELMTKKYGQSLGVSNRPFYESVIKFFDTYLFRCYPEFKYKYEECQKLNLSEIEEIIRGFEEHSIQVMTTYLRDCPLKPIKSILSVFMTYYRGGIKLSLETWKGIYFGNLKIQRHTFTRALLEEARKNLSLLDYFSLEDAAVENIFKKWSVVGINRLKNRPPTPLLLELIRKRLYQYPHQCFNLSKYSYKLDCLCIKTGFLCYQKTFILEDKPNMMKRASDNYNEILKKKEALVDNNHRNCLVVEGYFELGMTSEELKTKLSYVFPDVIVNVSRLKEHPYDGYLLQLANAEAAKTLLISKKIPSHLGFFCYIKN